MKVKVNMDELRDVIKKVKGVIPNTPSIKVLENLFIKAEDRVVTVTGSNLEDTLEIELLSGEVIETGKVLIDKDTLLLIEKIKDRGKFAGFITITDNEISYDNKVINFENDGEEAAEDYPEASECNIPVFSADHKELRRLLGVSYVCDKKAENYPLKRVVCIDNDYFVATDTYRLAKRKHGIDNKLENPVLISVKSVDLLTSLLSNSEVKFVNCYIDEEERHLCFEIDNIKHVVYLMQEKYFDWRNFTYPEPLTTITIDTKEALEELNLVKAVTEKLNYTIIMAVKDGALRVTGEKEKKSLTVDIPILKIEGEEMDYEIAINCLFMIDLLKQQGKITNIKFAGQNKLVVSGEDGILPLKLDKK